MNEDRPIVYTLTQINNERILVSTRDGRVNEDSKAVEVGTNNLMPFITLISERFNNKGYAVLFEVD